MQCIIDQLNTAHRKCFQHTGCGDESSVGFLSGLGLTSKFSALLLWDGDLAPEIKIKNVTSVATCFIMHTARSQLQDKK